MWQDLAIMRLTYLSFLLLLCIGCGGNRYLHLRDGIALECRHVERADALGGYLVELSESGTVLLVDDERVRPDDPVTGAPGDGRVIRNTDPGDASTALSTTATELVTTMADSLRLTADVEVVILPTENATPRRLSPSVVHESAAIALEGTATVVDGARRASIVGSIDLPATAEAMPPRAAELASFYGTDLVVTSRVTGLRSGTDGGEGYRYTLTLRAYDTTTGRARWHGNGSWLVDW